MSEQVFISYAHADKDFVRLLKEQLEQRGYMVWIDETGIQAGDNWRDMIDQAIKLSFAVIAVMTPETAASKYVTYEWSYAMGLGKPVVCILLEQMTAGEELHPRLTVHQYLNFTIRHREEYDKLYERLSYYRSNHTSEGAVEHVVDLMKQAQASKQAKNLQNAIDTYMLALPYASATQKDDIHYELGDLYLTRGNLTSAENHLKKAVTFNQTHVQALIALGFLYRDRSKNEGLSNSDRENYLLEAKRNFDKALNIQEDLLDPYGESVHGSVGGIYKRLGDSFIDKAIDAYRKATDVRKSSYPYNNLGLLYLEKRKIREMRRCFKLVERFADSKLMQNPDDTWSYNDLFVARVVLNKTTKAEDVLDMVLTISPDYQLTSLQDTLVMLREVDEIGESILAYINEAMQKITDEIALREAEQEAEKSEV